MAANLRNHIVIHDDASVSSVSGSGPSYTVTYGSTLSNAKIGHHVYIEKREAGAGASSTVLSTYVYVVTAVAGPSLGEDDLGGGGSATQLTIKYLYDTAGLGDDSPADLHKGDGSSGSPNTATHDIVMILGDAFFGFAH